MTLASVSTITGISVGIEFIGASPSDDIVNSIIVDFFVFRFIFEI